MTDDLSTINLFTLITEAMPWFLVMVAIISGTIALSVGSIFLTIRKLDHNLRAIFFEIQTLKSELKAKKP